MKNNNYSYVYLNDLGEDNALCKDDLSNDAIVDLVPYSVVRTVDTKIIDYKKILSDNGYSADTPIGIGMISSVEMGFSVKTGNGFESIFISTEDVNSKYMMSTVEKVLIYKAEMLAYWRKEYDLQNFFYENLDECDNVTFREIDEDLMNILLDYLDRNNMGHQDLEKTDFDAKMYYEWY